MDQKDDFYLSEEALNWINLKKSEYLSQLIEKGKEGDFGFEEYYFFNELVPQTIESSDKTFESEDGEYILRIYVKTYANPVRFHQVVIGGVFKDQSQVEVFVPIIALVTKFNETAQLFGHGKVISRPTLS